MPPPVGAPPSPNTNSPVPSVPPPPVALPGVAINRLLNFPLRLSTVSPIVLNSAATILCSSWYFVMPDKSNKSNPNAFCKLSNLPKTKVTPCITEFFIFIQMFLNLSLNACQLS